MFFKVQRYRKDKKSFGLSQRLWQFGTPEVKNTAEADAGDFGGEKRWCCSNLTRPAYLNQFNDIGYKLLGIDRLWNVRIETNAE